MDNGFLQSDQELIQQAVRMLAEKQPSLSLDPDEYTLTVARGPGTATVHFTRVVRYLPLSKREVRLEYDVRVDLVGQRVDPFDDTFLRGSFYIPSEEDKQALAFVKEHFGVFSPHFENVIQETEEDYKISCTNTHSYGHYSVNKKTGEQGPALQGSYLAMPTPMRDGENPLFDTL